MSQDKNNATIAKLALPVLVVGTTTDKKLQVEFGETVATLDWPEGLERVDFGDRIQVELAVELISIQRKRQPGQEQLDARRSVSYTH